MSQKYIYSFPIPSDKVMEWLNFINEIKTFRINEFSELHKKIGVLKECWFLEKKDNDYKVLIYTEAIDESFIENFRNDTSSFSFWFRQKVKSIQDVNLQAEIYLPKMILDWETDD
jgi:hypothetical protein